MSETTSTAKATGGAAKAKPKAPEMQRFFDALTANQKLIWEAMESARKRGMRINDTLADSLAKSQEDTAALMRKLISSPRDYKGNVTAVMEAITESQSHAMDLFKSMLAEYTQSRESAKTNAQEMYDNNREIVAATFEATQSWAAGNPVTESFKKGMAGFKKVAEATREAIA